MSPFFQRPPTSYVHSTSGPLSPSNDDEPLTRLPGIFSDVCSLDTPTTPYMASDLWFPSPSPPTTSYPSFNSTPPRPQHIQHASVSSGPAEDASASEDSNGSVPGPSQAMEICEDDEEDDHIQSVQHITPVHSVVALPRSNAPRAHVGLIGSDHIWACGRFDENRVNPNSQCASPGDLSRNSH